MNQIHLSVIAAAALSTLTAVLPPAVRAEGDPPARVGRVSYLQGEVTLYAQAGDAGQPLILNYPLTAPNELATSDGARAEVHVGSTALRLGPDTSVTFEALDDQAVQVRLDHGRLGVGVRSLGPGESVQVDLQTATVSFGAPGRYRVDQQATGDADVVSWEGDAEVIGGQASFHVTAGQTAPIPASGPDASLVASAPLPDDWDRWAADRERRDEDVASARYVSREMDGVEDLDGYGSWRIVAGYGPVWVPFDVPAGWAPYSFGRWAWVAPWGWTWVDDEPWGFAPFHYGRWVLDVGVWCWVPGPIVRRPVFAPALVYWPGGAPSRRHPPVAGHSTWIPLRPGQAFHPPYHASRPYVLAVNGGARIPPMVMPRMPLQAIPRMPPQAMRPPRPGFTSPTAVPPAPRPGFVGAGPRAPVPVRPLPVRPAPQYQRPGAPSFVPVPPGHHTGSPSPAYPTGRGRYGPRRGNPGDPWWRCRDAQGEIIAGGCR